MLYTVDFNPYFMVFFNFHHYGFTEVRSFAWLQAYSVECRNFQDVSTNSPWLRNIKNIEVCGYLPPTLVLAAYVVGLSCGRRYIEVLSRIKHCALAKV